MPKKKTSTASLFDEPEPTSEPEAEAPPTPAVDPALVAATAEVLEDQRYQPVLMTSRRRHRGQPPTDVEQVPGRVTQHVGTTCLVMHICAFTAHCRFWVSLHLPGSRVKCCRHA